MNLTLPLSSLCFPRKWSSFWPSSVSGFLQLKFGQQSEAQEATPEAAPAWEVVLRDLRAKRDTVSDVTAEYLMEYVLSPSNEAESKKRSSAAFELAKVRDNMPRDLAKRDETYDSIATCRFRRGGHLWREDIGEMYPGWPIGQLLSHFHGFDGEKFYSYDARKRCGAVGTSYQDVPPGALEYGNVVNGIRFLGLWEPLESLQVAHDYGGDFAFGGWETVNGEQCAKYVLSAQTVAGPYSRQTVWVCLEKSNTVVRRIVEVFRQSPNGASWSGYTKVENCLALEKTPEGVYVNKEFQEDNFLVKDDGKLHWQHTFRFTLSSVKLNTMPPKELFEAQFPPGTIVKSSEGRMVVGANPGSLPAAAASGQKPQPLPLESDRAPQPQPGEVFTPFRAP